MRWHSYQSLVARARPKLRRLEQAPLQNIETRRRRTTITRGGPHRKTQRMERSVRSRSAFCRHATVFRADFLYAEGYTVVVLVYSRFTCESSCTKFHRPGRSDRRRHLLSANRRFRFAVTGSGSARIRRGEIILSSIAFRAPNPVDRFISRFGCVPRPSVGDQPVAREEVPVDIQGPGGLIGYRLSDEHRGLLPVALGPVGSVLLVVAIYLTTLILVTGLRPIHLVREMVNLARRSVAKLAEWRVRRRIRKSDHTEQLKTQKQRRSLEALQRQLKKKGVPMPEPVATMISPDELANRPAPKVVDTTVLSNEPVVSRRRPSLAELRASEEKAKAAPSPTSAVSSWEDYVLPGIDLLEEHSLEGRTATDPSELQEVQQILIETLAQFGIAVGPGDITKGPTITRYEVYPAKGVRVDKIVSLERDLARATSAERINILAPIPGKDTVGIELANTRKVTVKLRELFQSTDWDSAREHAKIPLALGKDVYGKTIIADLAQMPHLLVAGTTGSGKSVCINALIASMLFRFTPEEMRLVIIDPKMVEMQGYQSLPHLAFPIVTDPKKVLLALRWLIDEMERRYKMFARVGVRNIVGFNARPKKKTQKELDAEAVESGVSPAWARNSAETADATPIKVPREGEEP